MKRGRRRTSAWGDGGGKQPLASGKAGFHLTCDLFNWLKRADQASGNGFLNTWKKARFGSPARQAGVLGCFADGGDPPKEGGGVEAGFPEASKSSQVFGVTRKTRMSGSVRAGTTVFEAKRR